MKKILLAAIAALFLFSLTACGEIVIDSAPAAASATEAPVEITPAPVEIVPAEASRINLNGNSAVIEGGGASVDGSVITISAAGEYRISGALENGHLVVNTGEDAKNVTVILENAAITCADGPAIHVEQAKKLTIELASGSVNSLVSGTGTELVKSSETAQGAVIFSEDDLIITGEGSLNITAYINNGITGKDDVKILSGNIEINAANNGIRGSESVLVENGSITVNALNDGIKSTSVAKENKGFITVNGGTIKITSGGDGISAATEFTVNGGSVNVSSKGSETVSGKSVKSGGVMTVNGGELSLSSDADKAMSSDAGIIINGGVFNISSGDDAVASHTEIIINAGEMNIVSLGDGIKAGIKGGNTGKVSISGGNIVISAADNPVDAKGSADISGGSIFAAGNAKGIKNLNLNGIAGVSFVADSQIPAKTAASVSASDGSFSVSITPARGYKLFVVIAPELVSGNVYDFSAGRINLSASAN